MACGVAQECSVPNGGVVVTDGVVKQGLDPCCSVFVAGSVGKKRLKSSGGVLATRSVIKKGLDAAGGVIEARGVKNQRIDSSGSIVAAGGVTKEGADSNGGIGATRGVADQVPNQIPARSRADGSGPLRVMPWVR